MKTKLIDFIDFERINLLLDGFNNATGFVTAILDLEGNILSKSGWRQICTEYHRVNPETAKKCLISNTELAGKLADGQKYHTYKCLNGLVDVAVPIIINDKHVANLFTGQFFMEKPDLLFFKKQAEKYKFDKKAYMEALNKVPIISEDEVKKTLEFLLDMTTMISEMTQQRIEQTELNNSLKKSEDRFRALYNNSPDMYVSVSATDASILQCNETLLKNLGYNREEVIGSPIYKMYHKSCLDDVEIAFQQFMETGEVLGKELILKRKDGSTIDVNLKVNSVKDEKGKILYSISSWRDITKQKQDEKQLIKSEDRFRNLYENSPFGIAVCELITNKKGKAIDFIHLQLNDAAELNTGLKKKEIVGKKASELLDSDTLKDLANKYEKVVLTKKPISYLQYFEIYNKTLQVTVFFLQGNKFIINFIDITDQKMAEEKLTKLSVAIEQSPSIIVITDLNGNYEYVNPRFTQVTGYTNEELLGQKANILKSGTNPNELYNEIWTAISGGFIWKGEFHNKKRNGEMYWESTSISPIFDDTGKMTNYIIVTEDITKQKQSEYIIQENEVKYRALFENAPLSYQSLDEEGRFIDINPSWLRTLGYEREEVIGKYYSDFLHPDWKPHFVKNFPAFKKRGYVKDVEFRIRHKDSHFLDISFEGCIGYLPDGSFNQTYCVFQDITESRKAENKLKMFNRVINHSLNAFDIVNHKGEFIYVNQAYADMWGYETTDEIIGSSPANHCHDQNLAGHIISEIKKNGKFISEIKAKKKDGSVFDVLMYARLDYDEDGNEIYPTTSLDITDRKKAEIELEKANSFFQDVTENVQDGIWVTDKNDVIFYANRGMEKIAGVPKDMIIGNNVLTDFPEETTNQFNVFYFKARKELKPTWYEVKVITPIGVTTWQNGWLIPVLEKEKFNGIICTIRDVTNRKKAEDDIIETQKRLFEAERIGKFGNWSNDLATGKIEWSEGLYRLFGLDPKDSPISYDLMMSCIHKDDREKQNSYFENMQALLPGQTLETLEYRIVLPNKEVTWIEVEFETQFENNKPIYFFGTARDITERKKLLKTLQQRNEYIEMILDNMPIGFALNTISDGNVEYMNNHFENIYGWSRDILTNTSIFFEKVFPDPEYREKMQATIISDMESGDPHRMNWKDLKIVTSSGEVKYVHAFNIPIIEQNLMISTVQDTTQRYQAEDDLKKQKEMFELVINSVPSRIFWKDINSVYLGCNKAFADIAGPQNKEAIIGKSDFDLTWAEEAQKYIDDDKQVINTGVSKVGYEENYTSPNDKKVWWRSSKMPLKDEEGNIFGILATSEDITQGKQAAEDVSKLNDLLNHTGSLAKIGGWELDLQTNLFYFTDEMYQIYEITPGLTLSLEDGLNLYPPETQLIFQEALEETTKRNVPFTTEALITTKKGNKKWVRAQWKTKQINGKVVKLMGTLQDITVGKQIEKALVESEERLRFALETNNTGAWELNLSDHSSTRTLLHDQIFGYETALTEWTFEMFLEHVIPEDREKTEALFMKAVKNISDWDFECRIQRPDGEIRWISALGRHIIDSQGKASHISGVVQDITENKKAEKELQQITDRLQFATEGSNIGTWHWNIKTGELIWSSIMKELFDVPQDEAMSYERFSQTLHPEDRARTDEAVKIALNNHTDFSMEYRCIWRDGSVHWRSAMGRGYYDESGENIRMEGVVIDINDKKNAEQALIESEQRLNEAQRMASIGYWMQDVQSGKLIWSDETYRIFEIDEEFKGELYDKFISSIHPEDREAVTSAYNNSLKTKKPYEIIHKILLKDGRVKHVHERCETEYDKKGNPVKSIGTIQDITTLQKAKDKLREIHENLEKLVEERTKELEGKNAELERMNKLFVGRELRMAELKQKIKNLEKD